MQKRNLCLRGSRNKFLESVRRKETTYPQLDSSPYAFDRSLQKYLKDNIFDSAHIGVQKW